MSEAAVQRSVPAASDSLKAAQKLCTAHRFPFCLIVRLPLVNECYIIILTYLASNVIIRTIQHKMMLNRLTIIKFKRWIYEKVR